QYTSNILNTPELDPEAYLRSSPIELAEGLQDHLLIAHGMIDNNVFYKDSVMLAQRLIELRKDKWELASYPLERHGFVHPDSWYDECRRSRALCEDVLQDGPRTGGAAPPRRPHRPVATMRRHERPRLRPRPGLPDRAAGPHLRGDRTGRRPGALCRGCLDTPG